MAICLFWENPRLAFVWAQLTSQALFAVRLCSVYVLDRSKARFRLAQSLPAGLTVLLVVS